MTRTAPRSLARGLARTVGALALGAVLAGAAIAVPAPMNPLRGQAAPASAADGSSCTVTDGTLVWGVKESFRAYISSSIANGEWEASDGATYATPSFTFSDATGAVDAETGAGSISFPGTVRFSGHDGVLNLTISNPTIEFVGDGTGRLRFDARSNDAQGELAIDEKQAVVGRIAELPALDPGEAEHDVELHDITVTLTADGAEAFAGFYPTGEELDPLDLSLTVGPCAAAAGVAGGTGDASGGGADDAAETAPDAADQGEGGSDIPWLPIGLGAGALVVIAIAGTLLATGRKRA